MKHEILFRPSRETEEELITAQTSFSVKLQRTDCKDSIVIGRYSVLPYYRELEQDLKTQGSKLINSYEQHRWIANFDYYNTLKQYTPRTYFNLQDIPEYGQFVVKGRTNSRKHKWNTQMFAKDRRRAIEIAHELLDDPLISQQGIIVRDYIPLETLEIGIHDQPFVNEHRLFYYGPTLISHGFYWIQTEKVGILDDKGLSFANKIAEKVSNYVNFFVLDIAKAQDGRWILIEVNDGQMSGLSTIDPTKFYHNLRLCLDPLLRIV